MLNNFIIKLFNIDSIENLDIVKSEAGIDKTNKRIDIYLVRHIFSCPDCCGNNLYSKGTRNEVIKHVLNGGEACNIVFHKRRYKCLDCGSTISESLTGFKYENGISEALKIEILVKLKDSNLTYEMISKSLNVSSTYVINTFDRYVDIRRHNLPEVLSIDEIYSDNLSSRCKYCLILF